MKTFPMRQQDATPAKPFYSVCYQYKAVPWTLYSCNRFSIANGRTQSGTSSFEIAKAQADKLITEPGIVYAQVSKTEDCYNHELVYRVGDYAFGK